MLNPVLLTAFYGVVSDYHATLSIKGSNESASTLTIIYDGLLEGVQVTTVNGDEESAVMAVQDCELIAVIARRESVVVGVAVFQVDVSLAGTHGLVLAPMTLLNVHVDQEDISMLNRAKTWEDQAIEEGAQVL